MLFRRVNHPTGWGHLYKNFFPPFQGIDFFPYIRLFYWKSKLLRIAEGKKAEDLARFIENSPKTYPYCENFSLIGPNSNTYIQWVIDHFPQTCFKLPWNAFGKDYKYKR